MGGMVPKLYVMLCFARLLRLLVVALKDNHSRAHSHSHSHSHNIRFLPFFFAAAAEFGYTVCLSVV